MPSAAARARTFALTSLLVAVACGGSSGLDSGDGGATVSCTVGCPDGRVCGYAIADGCPALGQCVTPLPPESCNAVCLLEACGCNGTDVSWAGCCAQALPDGYAPAR